MNLAINYGGRAEIVDAVNGILERRAPRGPAGFAPHRRRHHRRQPLHRQSAPDPDLLIRTSGEMRISNFLLWQIAYAELYVTETLWPDFNRTELLKAILDYQKRDRRYGGLSNGADNSAGAQQENHLVEAIVTSR